MVFKFWISTLPSIKAPFKKPYSILSLSTSHEKCLCRWQEICLAWFHDFSWFRGYPAWFFLIFAFWYFLLKAAHLIKNDLGWFSQISVKFSFFGYIYIFCFRYSLNDKYIKVLSIKCIILWFFICLFLLFFFLTVDIEHVINW